jgi:hypothetical protein
MRSNHDHDSLQTPIDEIILPLQFSERKELKTKNAVVGHRENQYFRRMQGDKMAGKNHPYLM